MMAAPLRPSRRFGALRPWLLGFGVWTLLALLAATQGLIAFGRERPGLSGMLVLRYLIDWYTCALFTPLCFMLVRRWPITRASWPIAVPGYVTISAVFVVIKYALFSAILQRIPGMPFASGVGEFLRRNMIFESIVFWCLLGLVHAIEYARQLRERDLHAARLTSQLATTRLDLLASRLQPHFLFNTLQGISTLLHRDPAAADAMLGRLGDLLRMALDGERRHEVPLREELELLDAYLGIVQARFGDRLTIHRAIADEALAVAVPRLVLQPLVENALEHGIARRPGAGTVEIAAARDGDRLLLRVSDDGPGLAPGGFPRDGIGLSTTRERLATLYGAAHELSLGAAAGGGFEVRLRLPWRRADGAA